jgi:hypothetical protein
MNCSINKIKKRNTHVGNQLKCSRTNGDKAEVEKKKIKKRKGEKRKRGLMWYNKNNNKCSKIRGIITQ